MVDPQGRTLFAHEPAIRRAVDPDLAAHMVHFLRKTVDRIRAAESGRWASGAGGGQNGYHQRQHRRVVYGFYARSGCKCMGEI